MCVVIRLSVNLIITCKQVGCSYLYTMNGSQCDHQTDVMYKYMTERIRQLYTRVHQRIYGPHHSHECMSKFLCVSAHVYTYIHTQKHFFLYHIYVLTSKTSESYTCVWRHIVPMYGHARLLFFSPVPVWRSSPFPLSVIFSWTNMRSLFLPLSVVFSCQMFPVAEVVEFLEANESPRPVCLRANSLKVNPQPLNHKPETLNPTP